MRVVVIVVIIDAFAVNRVARIVGAHFKEVRVNLAGKSMVRVIGIRMDVLKRREEKREQQGQNRLDCCHLTHH